MALHRLSTGISVLASEIGTLIHRTPLRVNELVLVAESSTSSHRQLVRVDIQPTGRLKRRLFRVTLANGRQTRRAHMTPSGRKFETWIARTGHSRYRTVPTGLRMSAE